MNTFLFDFDGTLVDSMPTYGRIIIKILDKYGVQYADDIIKIVTPLGFPGTAKYMTENMGVKVAQKELIDLMNEYLYYEYANNIPAKNNVTDVLKKLKQSGADLNVLTASPHVTIDPCLKRLGIFDLFRNVWSCDDFKTTKADPGIYKAAAEKIGQSVENILFFDDNYNADKAAVSAGMKVCGVYDKSSEEYTEDIKSVCDYYIYDFSELFNLFD
ncbi:MAG: HAD family phosphatase [Clostridia bacterium]|nr:HAD family phosphatase [Clostridia bacterium]